MKIVKTNQSKNQFRASYQFKYDSTCWFLTKDNIVGYSFFGIQDMGNGEIQFKK